MAAVRVRVAAIGGSCALRHRARCKKLPYPAALFLILSVLVWILSALLALVQFSEIDPWSGQPIQIKNQSRARRS